MPSVVELQNKYLVPLINKLPQIFHDEMNGYDFELDFSGTELDFDEITAAFRAAGVSEEEVMLFMKNEIDCREVKIERIRDLLEWLEKTVAGYLIMTLSAWVTTSFSTATIPV